MKTDKLSKMVNGWFIGNFDPSIIKTDVVEVGVKTFYKGNYESSHYHKEIIEITVVINGKVKMFGQVFEKDDIIVVEPYDVTDFVALEDTVCVVAKFPGLLNNKFIV